MFHIAICDDDLGVCSLIESTLLKYSAKNYIKMDLEVFYSGESLLAYIKQGNQFNLIYLDIELKKINGVDVGKHIRKVLKDYNTEIVYVSGKNEYDRQLFDVQPLHFISKPINSKKIIQDLNLAIARSKKINSFFKYHKSNDRIKVPIKDILYFESLNREIRIVLIDKEDFFYGNMEEIFNAVSKYQFIKIHRSYIINYNYANVFKYNMVIMSNGAKLPISQSRRKKIREMQIDEELRSNL
jgi:DNA-binding LytR/AlgR family response regulator